MMKVLLVGLSLAVMLQCSLQQRRINNAQQAAVHEFPYMAIVTGEFNCGGALISSQFVLTAAHCLPSQDSGESIKVVLGARNFYDNDEAGRLTFRSKQYWLHENYSLPSAVDDVAVIKLPQSVEFSDAIKAIKLSKDENVDRRGEVSANVIISGWGNRIEAPFPVAILRRATVTLISIEKCLKYQPHYVESVTLNHICVNATKDGKDHSPCNADSGTPLVLEATNEVIGITSFVKDAENGVSLGKNICNSTIPAVYTRVTSHLRWIAEKTGLHFD